METLHVSVDNFEEEVLHSDKPVLVDFWASWCGPCKMLAPVVDEIASELEDVKICKVNVDEQGELAERYQIMSIPSLLVFKNGEEVKKSIGLISKDQILDLLQ